VGFKVLVSDPLADEAVSAMRNAGLVVDVKTDLSPEILAGTIPEYDALVVRSATKVRAPIIDAATNLKLIVRAGVGIDNIDVDYAKSKGIEVRNTPAASSNSVAELALGHILSTARYIGRGTVSLKEGKWEKKALKGVEIEGKTLGIIGLGRIGQSLARKAAALGMRVIAFDKYVTENPLAGVVETVSFEALLRQSDFISLHVPFDSKEGATLGSKEFALMEDGVRIINCARGGVVDEAALTEALVSGKVAAAAMDVFVTEPPDVNDPLFAQENLSLTPHIGAATVEAQGRVGREAAEIVIQFAKSL